MSLEGEEAPVEWNQSSARVILGFVGTLVPGCVACFVHVAVLVTTLTPAAGSPVGLATALGVAVVAELLLLPPLFGMAVFGGMLVAIRNGERGLAAGMAAAMLVLCLIYPPAWLSAPLLILPILVLVKLG